MTLYECALPTCSSDVPFADESLLPRASHALHLGLEHVAEPLLYFFRACFELVLSPRSLVEVGHDAVLVRHGD